MKKSKYAILIILSGIILLIVSIIMSSPEVSAGFSNITVQSLTEKNYSSIWLGISTGGYDLITPRGQDYVFRIFVKNGMAEKALNDLAISPKNFSFQVNSIRPKTIAQLKPMEIVIFYVNATIPEDTPEGRYALEMDVSSFEFPKGVFILNSEIKVVKKINLWLYGTYALITILLLVWLFVRKSKIWKQEKGRKREPE